MRDYLPGISNDDWRMVVWHEGPEIDLPNRLFRNRTPKNFNWNDDGISVLYRQSLILSHRLPFNQNLIRCGNMENTYQEISDILDGPPDCVWTVTLSSAILWDWFSNRLGINVPFFLQEHSVPLSMHLKKKHKILAAKILPARMKNVAVVADRQIKEFTDISTDYTCRIIWNSVDEVFMNPASKVPINNSIVFVGRLSKQKGLVRLLRACSLLKKENIDFSLDIIGFGEMENELKIIVKDLKLEDAINFQGPKTAVEIAEILDSSALFVLPSVYENCPVSLLEAQIKGVPCLVTENGASEKVLLPGNGLSVREDGSGKELSRGLLRMLQGISKYNRKEIRERAIKKFSPNVFAKKMYELMKEEMQ
jgi:glycosyltransferase involved in cell wall biosynthesis